MDAALAAIDRLADRAARTEAPDIDWSRPPAPPAWMSRRAYAGAISQLYHGEIATGRMCRLLADRVPAGPARRFIRAQADDEMRHAGLYEAYLARLGDIAPIDTSLAAAIEGGLAWRGSPLASVVAYNIVLEGEALYLLHVAARRLPCATLGRITAAIAVDEARHIAFGRLYLRPALAALPVEERLAIYRWVRRLWHRAAAPSGNGAAGLPGLLQRARRRHMEARWQVHRRALADIGLPADDR